MKRSRVLMMITALLATAASANAQSLSTATLVALEDAAAQTASGGYYTNPEPQYILPASSSALPRELAALEEAALRAECAAANEPSWYIQAVQHGAAALQRVRAMCVTRSETSKCYESVAAQARPGVSKHACCEAASAGCAKGVQVHVQATRTGNLMLGCGVNSNNGLVGNIACGAQSGCPIACGLKEFIQLSCPLGHTSAKATAPCCCAKACACCEACKSSAKQVNMAPPMPPLTWAQPPLPYGVSGVQGRIVIALPPPSYPTYEYRQVVQVAPAQPVPPPPAFRPTPTAVRAPQQAAVKFITPDFEAHCETMLQRGDVITLQGNVLLLCRKHAQPVRIEAPRVHVNLKDGSWTVDSGVEMPRPVSLTPTSGPTLAYDVMMPAPGMPVTTQRIYHVLPLPQSATPR